MNWKIRFEFLFLIFPLANSTIMRSYSSAATTISERTAVMANLSAYQGIGFILGPRKFNY